MAADTASNMHPEDLIKNLLTSDYRGAEFKRECLARIVNDEATRAAIATLLATGYKPK